MLLPALYLKVTVATLSTMTMTAVTRRKERSTRLEKILMENSSVSSSWRHARLLSDIIESDE